MVPPLRILDSIGGLAFGAVTGLAGVWVVGTALLYIPGEDELRRHAQESRIVSSLTSAVPAERVMDALGRIDPFLTLVGPSSGVDDPDTAIVRDPDVRAARDSVVRVRGIACGAGIQGSGWIAGQGLVVTNAHVVAGIDDPLVDRGGGRSFRGTVVAFDPKDDVAVIRVPGLEGRALQFGTSGLGAPAAALGFPANGPYLARPARVGRSASVTSRDAYGRIRLGRDVVTFRGKIEGGSSGGPLVDAGGEVAATVFARRKASADGYAVPNEVVRDALRTRERRRSRPSASRASDPRPGPSIGSLRWVTAKTARVHEDKSDVCGCAWSFDCPRSSRRSRMRSTSPTARISGMPFRSCMIGMRLADEAGLEVQQRSALFYGLLLKDAGCSSNAAKVAAPLPRR